MEFLPTTLFPQTRPNLFTSPFRAFDEVVRDMFRSWPAMQTITPQTFPVDILEYNDKYLIKADLPGIDRKCVDISFENNLLTLRVEEFKEKEEKVEKEANFLVRERLFSECARSIPLPLADVKATIDAVMKDGVLKIVVPKSHEKQTKKIEIH